MKVLLVEDEPQLADFLKKNLLSSGCTVDVAHHGDDAFSLASSCEYEIILMDIMLPGMDGREVMNRLRDRGKMTPVIFITGIDGVDNRVAGLNLGADDYVVKPFVFEELLARMQAILRRMNVTVDQTKYSVSDLVLDVNEGVKRRGTLIHLTPRELSLLTFLMHNKGVVLSRTRIAESLWKHDDFHETSHVDVYIRRLREKIDGPYENKLIHTVRSAGFILEDRG